MMLVTTAFLDNLASQIAAHAQICCTRTIVHTYVGATWSCVLGIVEVAMNLNASNIVVGGDRRVFVTPLTYRPSD